MTEYAYKDSKRCYTPLKEPSPEYVSLLGALRNAYEHVNYVAESIRSTQPSTLGNDEMLFCYCENVISDMIAYLEGLHSGV